MFSYRIQIKLVICSSLELPWKPWTLGVYAAHSRHLETSNILQWLPARLGTEGNEAVDELSKVTWNVIYNSSNTVTLDEANSIIWHRLRTIQIRMDYKICMINANRKIIRFVARLWTRQIGSVKINRMASKLKHFIEIIQKNCLLRNIYLRLSRETGDFPPKENLGKSERKQMQWFGLFQ